MKIGTLTKTPGSGKSTIALLAALASPAPTYVTESQEDVDARRIRNFIKKAKQNGLASISFEYVDAFELGEKFADWKPDLPKAKGKGKTKATEPSFNFFIDGHGDMTNEHLGFFADYCDVIIVPHSYTQREKSWKLLASTLDCLKEEGALHKVKVLSNFGKAYEEGKSESIHIEEMLKVTDRWDDVEVNMAEFIKVLPDGFEKELSMGINPYNEDKDYLTYVERLLGRKALGSELTDKLDDVFDWLLG